MAAGAPKKLIEDLDLLRAVSVIAIVVHHTNYNLFRWGSDVKSTFFAWWDGSFGPDLFFAISGFIIARDLVPRLLGCNDTREWRHASLFFWTKRIFRILPSAWFWLFAMLGLSVFFNDTEIFGSIEANVGATLAGLLQVANFRFAHSWQEYFYGASFVYWTLSLEEQFYLVLPFLTWFARDRLVPILFVIVGVQLLIPDRSALLLMIRTDALFLGVLIAIWSTHAPESYRRWCPDGLLRWRGSGCLLMLILTGLMLAKESPVFAGLPLRWSAISLMCAVLVGLASYDQHFLLPQGRLKQLLLWIGSRSYAIYLSHIPVFYATWELMHRLHPGETIDESYFWPLGIIAFSGIALASEANYRILEVPLRRRGAEVAARHLAERQRAAAAGR